jgi:hypothetical protein
MCEQKMDLSEFKSQVSWLLDPHADAPNSDSDVQLHLERISDELGWPKDWYADETYVEELWEFLSEDPQQELMVELCEGRLDDHWFAALQLARHGQAFTDEEPSDVVWDDDWGMLRGVTPDKGYVYANPTVPGDPDSGPSGPWVTYQEALDARSAVLADPEDVDWSAQPEDGPDVQAAPADVAAMQMADRGGTTFRPS